MLIGEVSRRTGLATSAIRYYEERGLIPPARRAAGRRRYEERDLLQLSVVQLALDAGFTLSEARQLVNEFGRNRWRRLAAQKRAEIRATAARLREMDELLGRLLLCECPDLEFCGRVIRRNRRPGKGPSGPSRASSSERRTARLRRAAPPARPV